MRLGVVGYLAKTGIGIMLDVIAQQLGAVCQLDIPHDTADPLNPSTDRKVIRSETWEPDQESIREFSKEVDVVVTVETDWGSTFFRDLKSANDRIKIAQIPMYEWFQNGPSSNMVDLWICVTRQCYHGIPFKNKVFLPWPVDTRAIQFSLRPEGDRATEFVHNAGNIGVHGRKGTVETIRAFSMTKDEDLSLTLRMQRPDPEIQALVELDHRILLSIGNVPEYSEMYASGDVLIYCSKFDGHALVSEEAMAAGMPVITNLCPPMYDHWTYRGFKNLNRKLLVPSERTEPSVTINQLVPVQVIDVKKVAETIWKVSRMSRSSIQKISVENREIAERALSWDYCRPFYRRYLEALCATQ